MLAPYFWVVAIKARKVAKVVALFLLRKPPKIFCFTVLLRISRYGAAKPCKNVTTFSGRPMIVALSVLSMCRRGAWGVTQKTG